MVTLEILRASLMLLHTLAGAAWFGSIFYGVFVLYPRMSRHFDTIAERERLLMAMVHGGALEHDRRDDAGRPERRGLGADAAK